jgi:hypothetical protein
MQASVRQTMAYTATITLGKDVEVTEIIEDFGFNHDHNEVVSCWMALRNWSILPYAGGWLDQPLAWRQDLQTAQAVYNEEMDILEKKIPEVFDEPPGVNETGARIKLGIFDGPQA